MSRTYREKIWYKRKHIWSDHLDTCPTCSIPCVFRRGCREWTKIPRMYEMDYSSNPGWFDHYYTSVLNRRETKRLEGLAALLPLDDANELIWPLSSKPTEYYW